MIPRRLRIGTRGSKLALEQTRIISELLLEKTSALEIKVVPVKTRGDSLPPAERGETDGKGIFTEDIESLLVKGELDIAVHSMKDLSTQLNPSLVIAATPRRGDPRDALVSSGGATLATLRKGASVGTSSLRRKAQLLALRRDLRLVDVHGNVETRINRMPEMSIDAVVLAAAGLDRLGLGGRTSQRFTMEELVPAAGQGTLAVEIRKGDSELAEMVSRIGDPKTMAASECEREFARTVGADCNVPIGAFASFNGRGVTLTGMIASPDGTSLLKRTATSTDPEGLGSSLGQEMLELGGAEVLAGVTSQS